MFEAKQFYLNSLANGPRRHDYVAKTLNIKFGKVAVSVRDSLIKSGHIVECGHVVRGDGRQVVVYKATGKKLIEKKVSNSLTWEDGTPKSRFNAFDWENFAQGLFDIRELTASEAGRKMGLSGNKYDKITVYSRAGV